MWDTFDTNRLIQLYEHEKNLEPLALELKKSTLHILRKLVSLGIYEKKEVKAPAMNKDMLARKCHKLLGIKLLTMSNMGRNDLIKLLEHLESEDYFDR